MPTHPQLTLIVNLEIVAEFRLKYGSSREFDTVHTPETIIFRFQEN